MPHVVVEYSANLEEKLDIRALLQKIHAAVLASGVFKVGAVRTRAERREVYVIADGDPDNAFFHTEIRMAPGRDPRERKSVAQGVLDTIAAETRDVFARAGLGLSVEVREIDNSASVRLNNLHERIAAKGLALRAKT
jgi:5-carboxymethyl-2-hydroxymuconate isomerase